MSKKSKQDCTQQSENKNQQSADRAEKDARK